MGTDTYKRRNADGVCTKCGNARDVPGRKMCAPCLGDERQRGVALRNEVLAAYGGRCQCPGGCDVVEPQFLALDHVQNGGAQQRKIKGQRGSRGTYHWLKKHGFPKDDFRLLCHNCNQARHLYGHCPHEKTGVFLVTGENCPRHPGNHTHLTGSAYTGRFNQWQAVCDLCDWTGTAATLQAARALPLKFGGEGFHIKVTVDYTTDPMTISSERIQHDQAKTDC